ncbi:hypothetical protein mRhiFer1_009858 [Rhinolophus ferrumequinum]|uniref:Uncharacterized protein n=1 Tax=Rhinolophus ferrumequinum TaxID=59479 RepID=A0A7J7YRR0_RHIFE|nr:hypothetical protein mRhiFer1_009858 [Rhinolophus ferrumequinum]
METPSPESCVSSAACSTRSPPPPGRRDGAARFTNLQPLPGSPDSSPSPSEAGVQWGRQLPGHAAFSWASIFRLRRRVCHTSGLTGPAPGRNSVRVPRPILVQSLSSLQKVQPHAHAEHTNKVGGASPGRLRTMRRTARACPSAVPRGTGGAGGGRG